MYKFLLEIDTVDEDKTRKTVLKERWESRTAGAGKVQAKRILKKYVREELKKQDLQWTPWSANVSYLNHRQVEHNFSVCSSRYADITDRSNVKAYLIDATLHWKPL